MNRLAEGHADPVGRDVLAGGQDLTPPSGLRSCARQVIPASAAMIKRMNVLILNDCLKITVKPCYCFFVTSNTLYPAFSFTLTALTRCEMNRVPPCRTPRVRSIATCCPAEPAKEMLPPMLWLTSPNTSLAAVRLSDPGTKMPRCPSMSYWPVPPG